MQGAGSRRMCAILLILDDDLGNERVGVALNNILGAPYGRCVCLQQISGLWLLRISDCGRGIAANILV